MTVPKPFGFDKANVNGVENWQFSKLGTSQKSSITLASADKSYVMFASPSKASSTQSSAVKLSHSTTFTSKSVKRPVEQNLRVGSIVTQDLQNAKKEQLMQRTKLKGEDDVRYLHKKLKAIKIITTQFD